ncbi:MAG: VWA domain-containing protein [Candidatus Omnitrophica bacterium]|nr:VWA domain-containing protein [Candidatus Omnitrophota bacterium]
MHFAQLNMFVWLWAVIGLVMFLVWAKKHHKKAVELFTQEHLVKDIVFCFDPKKAILKNVFLVAVFIFSVLALTRPQWGFQWQEVKRQGIDILVVIDTSKSMLTQDVKPNRLERTKFAVFDLLKKLKGDRIGLIAFSGESFLICPLTVDYGGFQVSLKDLSVDTVPRGGTNIAKAVQEAIKDYDKTSSKHKAIIIITDGDDLEGDPIAAAKKAMEKGIKVYCVGIGNDEGELIQIKGEGGRNTFLKDSNGNFVKSRLNERLLKQIALITGGIYIKASGSKFGLDLIYDRELSKLEKREIEAKMEKKYFERFQFPLSIALLLLVIETCLTTRKKQLFDKKSS